VPAQYTYGTSGRNILRADGLVQFDFTVTKQFKFTESKSLQFRAEFFKLFNTPTFVAPASTIDTATGGQIGSALNAGRTVEMAWNCSSEWPCIALRLNFTSHACIGVAGSVGGDVLDAPVPRRARAARPA
jgi:hypothetical protein